LSTSGKGGEKELLSGKKKKKLSSEKTESRVEDSTQ